MQDFPGIEPLGLKISRLVCSYFANQSKIEHKYSMNKLKDFKYFKNDSDYIDYLNSSYYLLDKLVEKYKIKKDRDYEVFASGNKDGIIINAFKKEVITPGENIVLSFWEKLNGCDIIFLAFRKKQSDETEFIVIDKRVA